MLRRQVNRIIAELLPEVGGAENLLRQAADAMRSHQVPTNLCPLKEVLEQDDALGQIYQAVNAPKLLAAYRSTAELRRKFTAAEIPLVTQLFTPKWVVEFLLQNTLGRLWIQMYPDSKLREIWKWLAPDDFPAAPVKSAREIRICDPACGTMNFGLVAIDMLRDIYRDEAAQTSGIDATILHENLFGIDIDPVAIGLARQSLEIKTGCVAPNLHVADSLHEMPAGGGFDVVVTNPPYLSARNLDSAIVGRLKKSYPSAWRDACACFISRALQLLRPGGRAGILSMQSFMFTGAFERFRKELSDSANVETVAHFGSGLFDIGNPGTLQTAAVVFHTETSPARKAIFFRLVDSNDKCAALREGIGKGVQRLDLTQSELNSFPRRAWMYWLCPAARRAFAEFPALGRIAPPRQGLATTDNRRFVRYWWEVESPGFTGPRERWMIYAKGGRFRRWYEAARHRVDWADDGREIKQAIVQRYPYLNGRWEWVAKNSAWYGKSGITYSYLTSGTFSARMLEAGAIFDVAGSSLFPDDPIPLLGILNSSVARRLLSAINPTVNFQVGDLRQLPIPQRFPSELAEEVNRAIAVMRQLESFDETSPEFHQPAPWDRCAGILRDLQSDLTAIESRINQIVAELYGMSDGECVDPMPTVDPTELARRWASFAMGVRNGRWNSAERDNLPENLRELLEFHVGIKAVDEIEAALGGLDRFLAREFFKWHKRLYHNRPVFTEESYSRLRPASAGAG